MAKKTPAFNVNDKIASLVNEMQESEHAFTLAKQRFEASKDAIKAFAQVTGCSALESPTAKVSVYEVSGGTYLDPAKVKSMFGEDGYNACLSAKKDSVNVRLTLKK